MREAYSVRWTVLAATLLLALSSHAEDARTASPEPLFHYRVLINSFRKDPANTPERVAADLKTIVPDDIKPWAVVSLEMSVDYNYLHGDTPLEFARRFDRHGYRFMLEIADPGAFPRPAGSSIRRRSARFSPPVRTASASTRARPSGPSPAATTRRSTTG